MTTKINDKEIHYHSEKDLEALSIIGEHSDKRGLVSLVEDNEAWLMERILHYAREHEYAQYTSTLVEAWRASIVGLNRAIAASVNAGCSLVTRAHPSTDPRDEIITRFAVEQSRKHRERGIDIRMFLGLFKYYKRSYLDMVGEFSLSREEAESNEVYLHNLFDAMEVEFCAHWLRSADESRIDELQQKNRLITNEKNKYLTLFDSISNPAVFVNKDGDVENLNFAASKVTMVPLNSGSLYYSRDEVGKAFSGQAKALSTSTYANAVSLKSLFPEHHTALQELAEKPSLERIELEFDTGMELRYFQVFSRKVLDVSSKFEGVIYLFHDITELREIQEELTKTNKEMELFNAAVSHDLRAPVRQIKSFLDLMQRAVSSGDTSEMQMMLEQVEILSKRSLEIVEDLFRLSRVSRDKLNVEMVNISNLAQSVADSCHKYDFCCFGDKLFTVAPDLVDRADAGLMRILLDNLFGNAIKFSHREENPKIEFGSEEIQGRRAYFVRDNGVGFDTSKAEALFTPFCRMHDAKDFKGTGIGLATCKTIVERQGGTIWIESSPGEGTTVWFTLT